MWRNISYQPNRGGINHQQHGGIMASWQCGKLSSWRNGWQQ